MPAASTSAGAGPNGRLAWCRFLHIRSTSATRSCARSPMPRVRRPRRQTAVLELLEATLPESRRGLTESAARTVAYELFEKLGYGAVAVTDTHRVLAFVGAGADHHGSGAADPPCVRGALPSSGRCWRRSGSGRSAFTPPARSARRRAAASPRLSRRCDRRVCDRGLPAQRGGGRDARGARQPARRPSCRSSGRPTTTCLRRRWTALRVPTR